ncbi:MAG: dihydroorotate dehydrogenase electron transfer subunit [Gammaproteobacteria bacterium]|nr:dihydroorotate dehydrogenase electron transfer subunit [Gammaproteobacteria bacterium]
MKQTNPAKRATVFIEQASVLSHTVYSHQQYRMVLHAPRCAKTARPANFVHLRCSEALAMRRPYSIMSASREQGHIEILYKVVGKGSQALSQKQVGDEINLLGPIGNSFVPHPQRPELLLLGGGVGIPPILFLAKQIKQDPSYKPLVIVASEIPFPFELLPSQLPIAEISRDYYLALAELETLGIPSRLASGQQKPGCFNGYIDMFARRYLEKITVQRRGRIELFACGPEPMLKSVSKLSAEFKVPCQLAVEEYMACGVGGCAGCTVAVRENGKTAMKRVCVDGPVFNADRLVGFV